MHLQLLSTTEPNEFWNKFKLLWYQSLIPTVPSNVRYKGNSMATLNCQTSITERIPNSGFLLFFRNAFGKVNS